MARETLMGFVDYENFRMAFRNYAEYVTVDNIIRAFEDLGNELGDLRTLFFYGDWTRRPQDARTIEEHGHRAVNVLSTRYGKDRSDPAMAFDMYDTARDNPDVTALILGSGDSGFKEAILRCRQRGKRIYVLCFGSSASRELLTLTQGVYPLEARLNLTEKSPIQPAIPGIEERDEAALRASLIRQVDSLEKSLPHVVKNYLRDKILIPGGTFGETAAEVEQLLNEACDSGILVCYEIPNPKIEGRVVVCVKLAREHPSVVEVIGGQESGEAGLSPASP